jgi:hypothetical protein
MRVKGIPQMCEPAASRCADNAERDKEPRPIQYPE